MMWFSVPEDYFCVVRHNDTTLYGYTGSRRDTFTLNGFTWQKTATSTNSSMPSNSVCVDSSQIPSSIIPAVVISAVMIVIAFLTFVNKMIRRLYL